MRRNILPKRAQQVFKERHGQLATADCVAQRQKHLIPFVAVSALNVCPGRRAVRAATEAIAPVVNQSVTLLFGPRALIGKIIGRTGKRINSRDVWAHVPRQQMRRDRKILVVCGRQAGAGRVRVPDGPRLDDPDGRTHMEGRYLNREGRASGRVLTTCRKTLFTTEGTEGTE